MQEHWAAVNGFEGVYEVSTLGRVRRIKPEHGATVGKVLKQTASRFGYPCVMLCVNSRMRSHRVHRLVALAFVPNPRGVGDVNHKDGNKANNAASNLEWCTRAENHLHKFRVLGQKTVRGSANGRSVLTEEQVVAMKRRLASGASEAAVAREFGVHRNTLHAIVKGITWRHVIA